MYIHSIKERLVNLWNILWHYSLLEVIHNRFIVIDVYFDVALKCKHMLLVIDHHINNPPKTNQWSMFNHRTTLLFKKENFSTFLPLSKSLLIGHWITSYLESTQSQNGWHVINKHVLVPQMAELRTLFGFEEFGLVSGIGEVDRSVEVWRLVVVFGVLWCFLQVVTSTFTQVTSVVELTIINKWFLVTIVLQGKSIWLIFSVFYKTALHCEQKP